MSLVVTGASGHLGRLTVQSLLDRGVPAERIVATARTPETLDDLADRGVAVRQADYTDPQSLKEAFAGAERVLLVSSSAIGQRIDQHRNVIDAAREAGVDLIVYTSAPRADTTEMLLAAEHAATEQMVRDSGLDYVIHLILLPIRPPFSERSHSKSGWALSPLTSIFSNIGKVTP